MYGGGIWTTQNKVLAGSYINFVNVAKTSSNLGSRGIVAIALALTEANAGKVIEVTASDFVSKPTEILGENVPEASMTALKELFKHATKVYVYNDNAGSATVEDICNALEPYEFNILAGYTSEADDISTYISTIKVWRDTYGKKCQLVVYNATTPDYEGVINIVNKTTDETAPAHALVAWVAGAEAACAVNASCTNMKYDGVYEIEVTDTQADLEARIEAGEFAFHLCYGDMRVLEDINSLVTTTVDKGEDFKYNQTMRVCDQSANDFAKLFNTKYLGKIPNDDAGRTSLWGDIVKYYKEMETMRAIENFDSSLVSVVQGETKKSVVVNVAINVVNAMAQLYMTVVVQ